jgi:hypothetical protein
MEAPKDYSAMFQAYVRGSTSSEPAAHQQSGVPNFQARALPLHLFEHSLLT